MQKGFGPQIQVMTRKTKNSNWSKPEPLKLTPIGKMKYPYISKDGKYLFYTGKDISQGSDILIHSAGRYGELKLMVLKNFDPEK